MIVAFIVLLATASSMLTAVLSLTTGSARNCQGVASYELELNTFWSKDAFSKHYPQYRPHAQWSKIIGRSHSGRYVLWAENRLATEALREFAEKAVSTELDNESQGSQGIFDVFIGSPISTGVGSSRVKFLTHPNYAKLSFVARMIPSPDWFVGVNSLDLCNEGQWLSEKTLDLQPMDSGTDRGFTFTSPNWPEEPKKMIHVITSSIPNHQAGSFFYPELSQLPRIAQLKLKRIDTAWIDANVTMSPAAIVVPAKSIKATDDNKFIQALFTTEIEDGRKPESGRELQKSVSRVVRRKFIRSQDKGNPYGTSWANSQRRVIVATAVESGGERINCLVSKWSDWGSCSKTCGFGNRVRTRTILTRARNGGQPCPLLLESQLCGSMRTCGWQHFSQQGSR